MTPSTLSLRLVVAAATALSSTAVCAQSLARRIDGASGNAVQFHLAARPGVCGDGRNYIRTDTDSWYGSINDFTRSQPCEAGPLRVVVVKSGSEIIKLESYVGPVATAPDATDLGRVNAAEAVAWLGNLAKAGEGRVARDALLPLGLADSASVSPLLLDVARDQARSRDMRRGALNWLVRRRAAPDAMPTGELVTIVTRFASDANEHASFRQSALGQLARFDRGEGIPALVTMAQGTTDTWLARHATEALARSGDPRARRAVRALAGAESTPSDVRAAAIAGMGAEYGTAQDAEALARAYPNLGTDKLKDAALGAIAAVGGQSSRAFLLGVVRDESAPSRQRRRAASLLDRAGVPIRDVIGVYDQVTDGEVRGTLIDLMARAGTREATAKLMAIAKDDTQLSARRRAINALGRSEDPAVKSALRDLVGR
jgi:HEAT repeat protein